MDIKGCLLFKDGKEEPGDEDIWQSGKEDEVSTVSIKAIGWEDLFFKQI